ncbi:saccharopine dehydrogenase family protein [Prescottella sp. R16]|uniref:saccharopine dehydrogenase family protein n=1 Tax=Prescottella sp. R16 TaxID=3064529 RepID=UPI00272E549B|nr:saccharopine dehydrogenase NADP-binding domain-containing protein [Prescottella sp. R16]
MKLVVLGAGSIAGSVARLVAAGGGYDELVVADLDPAKATAVADELGGKAVQFDASDPASIRSAITGADIVFNAVGPFFKFGMPIIRAAIECGVNYVDVCDEFDVAEQLVRATDLDVAAKAAGVSVLFGMGFAPGVTSLLGRWAVDSLDSAHSVDVVMVVPYVVNMGPTINEHMLHSMSGDVVQFVDGEMTRLPAWGAPRSYTFGAPFDATVEAGYMGHPEGITLGTYVPGLRNATVRFAWFEEAGNRLWQQFEQWGLTDPTRVDGLPLASREFLARFMATDAGQRGLAVERDDRPGTVVQVAADGEIGGEAARVEFEAHVVYTDGASGDPTPHAAAAAVREMLAGRITRTGVFSPEACIDPEPFVTNVLAASNVRLYKKVSTGTVVG